MITDTNLQSNAMSNTKKSRDLATHFLNISIDDLKASDILYKNGHYPQAIFYLQQATEKLIKSYGYGFDIITDDKDSIHKTYSRAIYHGSWSIYSTALQHCNMLDSQIKRKIILDSPVLEYLFKEFKLGRRNFKNLNHFLSDRNKIKGIHWPDEIVSETLKQHYFIKQDILGMINDIKWNDNDNLLSKIFKGAGIAISVIGVGFQLYYLFPLFSIDISIILFKHSEISRYGIESHPIKLPNEIYTREHILIKEFNKIYAIIDNVQKIYLKL